MSYDPYKKDQPDGAGQDPFGPGSYSQDAYEQDPYASPYEPNPQPMTGGGYPGGGYGPGYPPPRKINGMALASMIVSIAGVATSTCLITGVVGAILGHQAEKQIAETGEDGAGFAKAGILVGWISAGLMTLFVLAYIAFIVIVIIAETN